MIVLQCAKCGAQCPGDTEAHWGRSKETNGYGPQPRCTMLVPNRYAPKAPDGSEALQVCGGSLAALDVADASRVRTLTPND